MSFWYDIMRSHNIMTPYILEVLHIEDDWFLIL